MCLQDVRTKTQSALDNGLPLFNFGHEENGGEGECT